MPFSLYFAFSHILRTCGPQMYMEPTWNDKKRQFVKHVPPSMEKARVNSLKNRIEPGAVVRTPGSVRVRRVTGASTVTV
jgi:hypothetical protein